MQLFEIDKPHDEPIIATNGRGDLPQLLARSKSNYFFS
jgi:hypothetical protein